MYSLRSNMSLDSMSKFDELQWVIQIRKILEEELEEDGESPVSIFNVPKLLMASDPDSYVPQHVAIGPYHYWHPEMHEMQRCKLESAKRFKKQLLQSLKFDSLVDQLTMLEQRIRASYHKFLDFNSETLVWMMAVDASFLLEFLQVYAMQEGAKPNGVRKSSHNAILRDIVMLENQIPLFVLRKMLEFKLSSIEDGDDMLLLMLIGLYEEISPFKIIKDNPNIQVSHHSHLLDFLYDMIVPKWEREQDIIEVECQQEEKNEENDQKSSIDQGNAKKLFSALWKLLSKLNTGPVKLIKKVLTSRPLKFIVRLPWKIISKLPGAKILKLPIEYLFFSQENENENSSSNSLTNKPPLVEEITIPSVSELIKCGVHFLPTNGSIASISFDTKTCKFYLPTIALDVNTQVFLRNLVAYESSVASGPLFITRYTELMNGIIDSEEDAKILREKGIVLNHLKSDLEVANMWNEMNKSLKLTKVPSLDKVIEDVNKYYNGTMKVKVEKLMKVYVFGSWKFLTFLATILLLLLMTLQAFCSVYTCSRLLVTHESTE